MSDKGDQLIEAIQSSGYQACIVLTGGIVGVLHALLLHPGASRFLLEAQVPYSSASLADYLGASPPSACSAATARLMAEQALARAVRQQVSKPMGIACTAALQTTRMRRGADRMHLCILSSERTLVRDIDLDPGTRSEQEAYASGVVLGAIYEFIRAGE
jgi:hypothetical protein